uniref:Uncharacterized protein n=1 Tax=Physcomitrium patens TaxID=3218 RepID=A0A2K1JUM0_PHYPA|nr:hypothetical protein PHYPA_015013 [Physcomitrium patens]
MAKVVSISFASTRHPSGTKLQDWLHVNLVETQVEVLQVCILQRDYFVFTFNSEQGVRKTLQLSPLQFGTHTIYLHPWAPQFETNSSKGIRILLWIRFPKLDDMYYRALPIICVEIGEVVWTRKQEDYLQKSFTPCICILVMDVMKIPSLIILLILRSDEEIEIVVEYEGIPRQCSNCLELKHDSTNCLQKKKKTLKDKQKASRKKSLNQLQDQKSIKPQ